VRGEVALFCVHEIRTVPGPAPLLGDTPSHVPFPEAVQLPPTHRLGEPVNVTVCDPAACVGLHDDGEMEYEEHSGAYIPHISPAISTEFIS
jgi:hypothetical protein